MSTFKKYFWVMFVIINICAFGFLSSQFFGENDYSVLQKEKSRLIGMSYMTMNNEFYQIVSQEIYSAVEANGDQIIMRDPALSIERQNEQIEQMIEQGISALIITPVDWKGIMPILEKVHNQGIYIISVDSEIYDPNLADITITSDNYKAGQIMGEYFLTQNESASLVLMTHQSAKSGRDRIEGFLEAVSENDRIQIVETLECEGQTELAMPAMLEFIESENQFDSVFCLNDQASLGVVAALDQREMLDKVKVYGVDASPVSKGLIYEHMMEATIAQFPNRIGKETGKALYALLNGLKLPSEIKIPVQLITRQNVNELGIDRWQ